jgi:hypothetical protein
MTEEVRRLQAAVEDLERRARAVSSPANRHDFMNAVGAARNALELLSENPEGKTAERFLEMAQRNIDRATGLVGGQSSGAADSRSARNEGDDLRGTSKGDYRETFGL